MPCRRPASVTSSGRSAPSSSLPQQSSPTFARLVLLGLVLAIAAPCPVFGRDADSVAMLIARLGGAP